MRVNGRSTKSHELLIGALELYQQTNYSNRNDNAMQCPRGLEKEYRSRVTKTKTNTKTFNTTAKSGRASVKTKTEARWQKEGASVD